MTLSVVFLLTTSPNVIYFLKIADWVAESNDDAHSVARLRLGFAVTNLLYYINNATNFFLYCLAGSRFRRAMIQTFTCRRGQEGRSVRAEGEEQATGSGTNANNRRRRTVEAPMGDMNSTVPAVADAGCITLSTNVTIHPSDQWQALVQSGSGFAWQSVTAEPPEQDVDDWADGEWNGERERDCFLQPTRRQRSVTERFEFLVGFLANICQKIWFDANVGSRQHCFAYTWCTV